MNISELRQALDIFEKYLDKDEDPIAAAEHDIIYSGCTDTQIPEESEDGKKLLELRWHVDSRSDTWARFV